MNAIEHVIIPRTENTIKCRSDNLRRAGRELTIIADINSELDELDREEFYRLKKVANKKQRDNAALDAEMAAKREAQAGNEHAGGDENTGPADVLGAGDDEDVIF